MKSAQGQLTSPQPRLVPSLTVDRLASHDKHHHPAGLLELGDKLLHGVSSNDGLALGLVVKEAVDLGDGTVVGNNGEAMVGSVENQVLAHWLIVRSGPASCKRRIDLLTA